MHRRDFLKAAGAGAIVSAVPGLRLAAREPSGTLLAGAAAADITPELGGEFFGYVRPDIHAEGVALRLHAYALVLDDGVRKIALVTADLGEPMVKAEVVERVRHLGFDEETVLLAATHTHAGPNAATDWTAFQIAEAIRLADQRRRPARAGWAVAHVLDANLSRSVEAHLANHGQDLLPGFGTPDHDPEGPDHTRDTALRLLRVEGLDGQPIAAWSHFSVHPTTFIPSNKLFSADFCRVATLRFQQRFRGQAPVAIYTNGNQGDLITWFDDYNQHAVADRIGMRVARAMDAAWDEAGRTLSSDVVVDARRSTVTYQGQEVEPGKRVGGPAGFFGASFFGGAKNGPSIFYWLGTEGKRRPAAAADPVHGRKILAAPAPWMPTLELQALRIGDGLLLGLPGEPSVETGRRVRAAALASAPPGLADAAVVGLANGYHGYFTTPEEYDQQHYEGGHTVFGKYTSLLVQHGHRDLAGTLAAPRPRLAAGPGGNPPVPAPVGDGGTPGVIVEQPRQLVQRMQTVQVRWTGGAQGRDRPVGGPFVRVKRQVAGAWTPVDDDLGHRIIWWQQGQTYGARWDLEPGVPTGTYRFHITSARYQLASAPFQVGASTGLRLLGVERSGGDLLFRAQHPPPDPERNLLARPRTPRGGTLRFTQDGREQVARWDEAAGGWRAPSRSDAPVSVAAGALTDGLGNSNGEAVALQVGRVAPPVWPPHIGPGGGQTPGPFGQGTFPP